MTGRPPQAGRDRAQLLPDLAPRRTLLVVRRHRHRSQGDRACSCASPNAGSHRGLLAVIVAMAVFLVYMSKLFNDWYRRFFNALQEKNAPAFWGRAMEFLVPGSSSSTS